MCSGKIGLLENYQIRLSRNNSYLNTSLVVVQYFERNWLYKKHSITKLIISGVNRAKFCPFWPCERKQCDMQSTSKHQPTLSSEIYETRNYSYRNFLEYTKCEQEQIKLLLIYSYLNALGSLRNQLKTFQVNLTTQQFIRRG